MQTTSAASTAISIEVDPSAAAQVVGVALVNADGTPQSTLTTRSTAWMQLDVVVNEALPGLDVSCLVATRSGIGLLEEMASDTMEAPLSRPGRYRLRCELPPVLTPGEFVISVWLGTAYENLEMHEDVIAFTVEGDDLGRQRRLIKLASQWSSTRVDDHLGDS
jgi:hypothetical protein